MSQKTAVPPATLPASVLDHPIFMAVAKAAVDAKAPQKQGHKRLQREATQKLDAATSDDEAFEQAFAKLAKWRFPKRVTEVIDSATVRSGHALLTVEFCQRKGRV